MWKKLLPDSNVSVITCLGNDENGRKIHDFLKKIGIDISRVYVKSGATACNQLRVDGHGERFGIEGTWQGGLYETFYLSDDDWQWVALQDIVAIPANNPNFSAMIQKKGAHQLLSVDYLDIDNNIPLDATVGFTDIAFITARPGCLPEYKAIASSTNKLIVVTLGAEGSYAFYNGAMYHQPALPVAVIVDTTGCGDAYQAAFAVTYYQSHNIQEAMYAGAVAASHILQFWGGAGRVD
jgi:fructoselysine 6-kinase